MLAAPQGTAGPSSNLETSSPPPGRLVRRRDLEAASGLAMDHLRTELRSPAQCYGHAAPAGEGDECGGGSAVLRGGGPGFKEGRLPGGRCKEPTEHHRGCLFEGLGQVASESRRGGCERYLVESTAGAEGG